MYRPAATPAITITTTALTNIRTKSMTPACDGPGPPTVHRADHLVEDPRVLRSEDTGR